MPRARRHFRNDPDGLHLRSSSTPPPTASSRRFRSRRCIGPATRSRCPRPPGMREAGDVAARSPVSAAGTATTLLAMNAAYAAAGNIGGAFMVTRDPATVRRWRDSELGQPGLHLRCPGAFRRPRRAMAQGRAAARPDDSRFSRGHACGGGEDRAPGHRAVRQGRLPRLRHRLHGAVVRAEHVRRRAADNRQSDSACTRSSRGSRARAGC